MVSQLSIENNVHCRLFVVVFLVLMFFVSLFVDEIYYQHCHTFILSDSDTNLNARYCSVILNNNDGCSVYST